MRAVLPVVVLLAAGAVMAAPRPKPLTAAQKAKLVQAKKAKAAAQAKAAAAKRARATAGTQNLGSRGSVIPRPGVRSPDQIGEPFPSMPPRAGGSELPAARVTGLPLFFRTASDYDVRLDLRPDFVAVQRPGAAWEELDRPLSSWRAAGWPAYRLLSLTRDPGAFFIGGKADGAPHPDLQA